MKKYLLLTVMLFLGILISSCSDIIDSDKNLKKTKVEYNYVKGDQVNSVIMPLKIGNNWQYKITEYDLDGIVKAITYDSIFVMRESTINNEQWFEVWNPVLFSGKKVLMTNTDVGLWLKTTSGAENSYLEAQFPSGDNPYYAGKYIFTYTYTVNGVPQVGYDTVDRWTKYENLSQRSFTIGTYDCIKYTSWLEYPDKRMNRDPYRIDYYVKDLGLVRSELYAWDGTKSYLYKLYDLTYMIPIIDGIKQMVFQIDFGQIHPGDTKTLALQEILANNSNEPLTVQSINIIGLNSTITVSLVCPVVVQPGGVLTFMVRATPQALGAFSGTIEIRTTAGQFDISVIGTCI